MTLVQNPLQLLNGNKIYGVVFLLFGLLLLPSCGLFKKQPSKDTSERTEKPKKPSDRTREEMDTVYWKQPAGDVPPPIRDKVETIESKYVKKDVYNVAVLTPLYTSKVTDVESNMNIRKMMHFNIGLQLAAEKYSRGKPKIIYTLFDIEAYNMRTNQLIEKDSLSEFDIIVGPFKTNELQAVASYGLKKGIPVISPWNSSSSIVVNNPLYIQLRPGLKAHCEAIAKAISEHHRGAKIYLVANETDTREIESFDLFRNSIPFKTDALIKHNLHDWIVQTKEGTISTSEVKSKLTGNQPKVFILPYWSDQHFVSNLLSQINGVKGNIKDIYVYGFPQWVDFDKMDMSLFKNLNIRLSYNGFIDVTENKVRTFRSTFFERYKTLPEEDAYFGYDIISWLSREIANDGVGFILKSDKKVTKDLFTPMDIYKVHEEGQVVSDDLRSFKYMENKAIQIIKLNGYRFSRL